MTATPDRQPEIGRDVDVRGRPAEIAEDVFAGDSEMAKVMRSIDWSATRLGPVARWPQSLRMMVRFLLANRFPLLLWWGPDYIQLYNDAYRPILGTKHPVSMGQPTRECWHEIWHILAPLIHTPFHGGPATWMEDILLYINRHGYVEETHFTIAYSPVPDETAASGIGGVLATVHEITQKVVGERRVGVLRDLGRRSLAEAQTAEAACATAAGILAKHALDLPFAAIYLIDPEGGCARLAGTSGVNPAHTVSPAVIDIASSPFYEALATETVQIVGSSPETTIVAAIPSNMPGQPAGVLVAAPSPYLVLDEQYLGFFELLAAHLATGIANARAYEQERRRAEMLAEVDRAKTRFFSNVSHEFRTPLTLMLAPTIDLIAKPDTPAADRAVMLEMIHRNALRLQKLVNSLLDFSRIEAGRAAATYESVDLAAFTAELASVFRSATERAGLELNVDAHALPAPVYVDREMWEKIILNLLSNAFKHTFEGSITVRVRDGGEVAIVEVADTGIGIAPDQRSRIFDRFHRVPNVRSRTHEGTGIGLALVQELVRWHGGRIEVASIEGAGTTFAIAIPYGTAHLPPERVARSQRESASARVGAMSYVEEALGWLPSGVTGEHPAVVADAAIAATADAPRILLADDNADMREYLVRLLRERGWAVEAVGDGHAALAAIQERRPDLVLSDVMMPRLDGFALLRAVRADPATASIPVVLLSARAGEEARIDGAQAGADDYLVKPFGAHELIARIGAQLSLSRERARALHDAEAASRAKSDFLAMMSHELRTPLNAIGGYASLMEMEVHGPLTDQQRSDLARIQQSQAHLLGLINQVLSYTLGRAGTARYDLVELPVQEALTGAEVLTLVQAQARGLRYIAARCDPALRVLADREKVQQILLNLLTNAIKFTEAGGEIRTICTANAESVSIAVADTGIGIAPDKLASIFEAFVQVDQRLTRPREGVGLGLAISRDLARGMGGDLVVTSAVGGGSTFTLTLPRVL
jgi:signal transduction histidine kinase